MISTRIIPCLLLKGQGLVKTVKFKNPVYIGDPINAVKIFNDKEVDELVFLDITATQEKRKPNFKVLLDIASECFMPLGYGGGITELSDIDKLFGLGIEKVIINSAANTDRELIVKAALKYGNQSIVASIDVRKNIWGKYEVFTNSGTKNSKLNPVEYAKNMEDCGSGEIFLNSIDCDGTMKGYDYNLINEVSNAVGIPVVASGGAGNMADFKKAINSGASAVSAGSMFVFQGIHRAVLISYPTKNDIMYLQDETRSLHNN